MFLTVVDVISRASGYQLLGTYEVMGLALAIVVGFGLPRASLDKAHVYMEFLVERLPKTFQKVMNTFTRLLCIFLFILLGYNLITVGAEFQKSGELSSTLKIPFFPVPYAEGICCLILCLVFIYDIIIIWRKENE
jgi:TRAP-type C4-dicarboxylate transport system permease small subunit